VASEALRNLLPTTPALARTYHYAVYGCEDAINCGGVPATDDLSPTIAQVLVGGGYNIVWRHANATVCADALNLGVAAETSYPDWWKSCDSNCVTATARQLSASGILQAEQMGIAIAGRGIPFGRVLASEFCRCRRTAEYMSLGPTVEEYAGITGFVYGLDTPCMNTMMLVAQQPQAGMNVAIVGHSGHNCGVLDTLAMGEAMIYKPDGSGGSIYITRVLSSDWATLP
jgi:phosphohistidine phosphatase SixA